jgi:solute carrier family 26 protein
LIYVRTFSLADIFAKKHKYKLNSTQELLAGGVSNMFGSFFSCYPSGPSISGSNLQDMAGGRTQFVSIISALLILIVLLFIGPLFKQLPIVICIIKDNVNKE